MTRREAERFAALVERAVGPGGDLPAVAETDAVAAFDAWLRAAPRLNRLALRALLRLPERARGEGRDLLVRLAVHCYYGDAKVLRALGYDADAVVARDPAAAAAAVTELAQRQELALEESLG